ncbi:uncharacterized protein LOC116958086 [Petromyzon marinus]|uniref:uncharacterized protein LOC116958086 n=1 Tax=Petromyzon marinus TaxID=7757 RepID=UPI003F70B428
MLQTSAPSAHENSRGTAMSSGGAAHGTRPHPWEAPQTSPQIPRCTAATRRRPPPATREDTGAEDDDDDGGDDDRGDGGGDDDDDDGCRLLRSCERRLAFRQEVGSPRRGAGARLLLPVRERSGKGTSAGATGGISSSRRPGTARRNARERNRVALVNRGFAALRDRVPAALGPSWTPQQDPCPGGPLSPGSSGEGAGSSGPTRLSKVETLRAAAEYIRALQRLLMLSESPRYYPEVTASPDNTTTTSAAASSPSTVAFSTTSRAGSGAAEPCHLASWFGLDAKYHPLFGTHEQSHEASPAWTGHEFWTGAGHAESAGGSFLQTSQEPGLGWAPAEQPRYVGHGAVPAPPLPTDTWGSQRTFGLSLSSASSSYSY